MFKTFQFSFLLNLVRKNLTLNYLYSLNQQTEILCLTCETCWLASEEFSVSYEHN